MVESKELKDIREYFITNQNKKANNDILDLTFDNVFTNNSNNNSLVNGYDNVEKFYSSSEETYEEIFNNSNLKMKMNCVKDCNKICNKFLDGSSNQIDNYKNCLRNCKNVMSSCKDYCDQNDDDDGTYCDSNNDNNNNNEINKNCPKVYKRNGKYVVYIPENGIYSGFFTGEKIFSADIDKARNMYAYNFFRLPNTKRIS